MKKKEPFCEIFPGIKKSEKSYTNYIRLHTGIHAVNAKDSLKTTLGKCLAAKTLKSAKKKFDIKTIHTLAKSLEQFPTFQKLTPDEMMGALANEALILAVRGYTKGKDKTRKT